MTSNLVARLRTVFFSLVVAGLGGEVLAQIGATSSPFDDLHHLLSLPFFATTLLASFIIHQWLLSSRRELVITATAAILAAVPLYVVAAADGNLSPLAVAAVSASLATALRLTIGMGLTNGPARERYVGVLLASFCLPLFILVSNYYLNLTLVLWPRVLDGVAYAADGTFGFQPSFALGRLLADHVWLTVTCQSVYVALPLVFVPIFVFETRRPEPPAADVLTTSVLAAGVGYLLYQLFPVVGPVYVFPDGFPFAAPDPAELLRNADLPGPVAFRNCMPSLHTAWALLVWWHARPFAGWVRATAGLFLGFTLLATLGLGLHYLVDLIVAVPFTLGVELLAVPVRLRTTRTRQLLVLCGTAVLGWMALIRWGLPVLRAVPGLSWVLGAATVGFAWWAHRFVPDRDPPMPETSDSASAPTRPDRYVLLLAVFFCSGLAALIYQVVFAKNLATAFGSTARATTAVLATYMGGLALGTWVGGRVAARLQNPVQAYAMAEAGIGAWCGLAPWIVAWVTDLYVGLASGSDPAGTWPVFLQVALGCIVLLPPTFLMGLTLPLLTRHFTTVDARLGHAVSALYGVNTLGAAVGALLAGYLLLPTFGVSASFYLAVAVNLILALIVIVLARSREATTAVAVTADSAATPAAGDSAIPWLPAAERRVIGWIALVLLSVGGFVTFGLENTYVHLLAVVAGNSAYAFSTMLFTFLAGLGTGSALARRLLRSRREPAFLLGVAELGLAASILLGVHLWNAIPDYFAGFELYGTARSFGAREFVRFAVCCAAMLPPAISVGTIYPLAMEWIGQAYPARPLRALGFAGALNTAGNVLGALVAGFILLPSLGSLRSLQLLAVLALLLAALPILRLSGARRRWMQGGLAVGTLLLAAQPTGFDLDRLTSGANVYFARQSYGHVMNFAESLDGGLTTIAESSGPRGERVLTMLTNGKFQGDDCEHREMMAQVSFALAPLLHTTHRGNALVIGLGTGVSARVMHEAGFERVDIAELSADIVRMARKYFFHVNGRVLDQRGVFTSVTDGRNFLLLGNRSYDVISMEVSSIWFAGAASLYGREFYRLAKSRLAPGGVLQQWVQLHHIAVSDVLSVLATVRSEFDTAWLYLLGRQGIIVACADCRPTPEAVTSLQERADLAQVRGLIGGRVEAISNGLLLAPEEVDATLAYATEMGAPAACLVSTDDNLLLEFSTPKGNGRPYGPSLRENVDFLSRFRARTPP